LLSDGSRVVVKDVSKAFEAIWLVSIAPIEIRKASIEAIADGIRRYLPGGISILVIGIPICLLVALAHLVLGFSVPATAGAGTLTTAIVQIIRSIRQC
jgi:hypothetical protein